MPIFSYLDKLRNKSDREKNRIVLISSLVITIIIVFFWLSFNEISPLHKEIPPETLESSEPMESQETAKREQGFIASFFSNIILGAQEIKEMIFQ